MNRLTYLLCLGLLMGLGLSCSGIQSDYQKRTRFLLSPVNPWDQFDKGSALLVTPLDISPAFEGDALVLRLDQNRFDQTYYHRYMVPPARMLTDILEEYLRASPLFTSVSPDAPAPVPYRVFGKIIDLYEDTRDTPKSVITLRLTLEQITKKGGVPLIQKTYHAGVPIDGADPALYIQGLNKGLSTILDAFVRDAGAAMGHPLRVNPNP